MIEIIFTILVLLCIGLFVVVIGTWIHKMITNKEFREANFESARKAKREREQKKRPYFSDRQYSRYLRTGNRHHLVYDYDDEEDDRD